MHRRTSIIIACAAAVTTALCAVAALDRPPRAGNAPRPAYRVAVDPTTGTLLKDAPVAAPDADIHGALSTSTEGLREEASPVPGGGIVVDLRGRFRSAAVATVGEDGALKIPCVNRLDHEDSHDAEVTR